MSDIALALRARRAEQDLSVRDLAPRIGVSFTTLAAWERGEIDPPLSRLMAWAKALGVSLKLLAVDARTVSIDDETLSPEKRAFLAAALRSMRLLSNQDARMLRRQIELIEEEQTSNLTTPRARGG